MYEDKSGKTRLVDTGAAEPSAKELKARQAALLDKLRSVTPDQLEAFREASLGSLADQQKVAWQKTVWAK